MSPPQFITTRRAIGLGALGLAAATTINYSYQQRLNLQPRAALQPGIKPSMMSNSSSTTTKPGGSPTPATPRAINLRDIGEVDPRLRKGVLFRCSQIYTPDVLKELKIKTVVDLRGRAERSKHKGAAKPGQGAMGTPPLLRPDELDALKASGAAGAGAAAAAAGAFDQGIFDAAAGAAVGGAGVASGSYDDSNDDMTATTLKRNGSPSGSPSGSDSESSRDGDGGSSKGARRKASGAEEVAAGLAQDDPYGMMPERENFNLIPGKEFGLAMLRMPWRVWRSSLGNLASGRDPRRPFVEAFADEQLLGFTKYYTIILEHAKRNIAAVMRVFAKTGSLPALVHCAHGKDRTGVIIMLLLLTCDVPHESIVQDYVQSEIELRRYRESLGLPDPTGATGAVIPLTEVIIASTQETLRALLAYMDATYITVDNYLASCGLTPQEIQAIRNNLMRPEAAAAAAAAPAGAGEMPASSKAAAAAEAAAAAAGAGRPAGTGNEL